ncbi:glycosyltransferase family 8 protein [Aidingimonas halophila]|uniref:Lipopolysaccharide biosynthesis protein, LPS:glycosyltransferase n=1 Tax=Aidingimonas halophila TaxID=574349 RepID=A0A1H3G5X4_9GAMM|nr:glycosyltransferase family 8 protein [Aidingimonas halophila]GHC32630.1 glycosyl transferase family 8 [Aidingimonas halophila]SDX98733.1 Lipopolysaccharide biosynthesis protein, LPS:glycosyltransferase [Aidingimonas halophila]
MIDIVLSADERYARYAAVVMASALANSPTPEQFRFFLLTPGLDPETPPRLRQVAESSGAQLQVIQASPEGAGGIDVGRFGPAGLLRLQMDRYLPEDCHRVIYLDCDLVILGDLADLWHTPLQGRTVAAVMDLCNPSNLGSRDGFDGYFNSGVMLIDLEAWRRERVAERAFEYLRTSGQGLKFPDQDALNHVMVDNWLPLSPVWNFQPTAYAAVEKAYTHLRPFLGDLEQAIRSPRIVHFIGSVKPWHPACEHPLQPWFLDYAGKTAWPIDAEALKRELSWLKRFRLALKQPKIRRRRHKTRMA